MNNAALAALRDIATTALKFRICSHRQTTTSRDVYRVEQLINGVWTDISGPLSSYAAATELRDIAARRAV